jgi:uncharacterized protein
MEHFTPLSALVGGALIGLSASLLMLFHGRVAGISGIFAGVFDPRTDDKSFRLYFIAGLLLAGVGARLVYPTALPGGTPSLAIGAAAGLLVGFGTRLGSGCTSGHGVCGLSRLSVRSLVATLTFMATAMLTVAVVHALRGTS